MSKLFSTSPHQPAADTASFTVSAGEDDYRNISAATSTYGFLTSPSRHNFATSPFPSPPTMAASAPNPLDSGLSVHGHTNGGGGGFSVFASNGFSTNAPHMHHRVDSGERAPPYSSTPFSHQGAPLPPPPPPMAGFDGEDYMSLPPPPPHFGAPYRSSLAGNHAQQLPQHHHMGPPPPPPGGRRNQRLHQDFKALSKEERKRLVEQEAAASDLLSRTVHLRFLPTTMLQSELAAICTECGPYLRVRICGNSTNNQNWIYGFVEFATKEGAANMMKKCGMELSNGPGRPPLRLKCNCAKQPIVDRVFHDADPATNTPCIFGLGNFAHRTIKDALDSYFNLKEKEAAQEELQRRQGSQQLLSDAKEGPHVDPTSHLGVGLLTSPTSTGGFHGLQPIGTHASAASSQLGVTPKLSPNAKAFQPNPGAAAFVPAGFALSASNAEAADTIAQNNGKVANPKTLSGSSPCTAAPSSSMSEGGASDKSFRFSSTQMPQGTPSFSTAALGSAGNAGGANGLTPGYAGTSVTTLGGRTPPSAVPPPSLFSCGPTSSALPVTLGGAGSATLGAGSRQTSDVPSSLGGPTTLTPTFTTAAYNLNPSMATPSINTFSVHGVARVSPMVDSLVLPASTNATSSEAVGSQLTMALQAMMNNSDLRTQKAIADAEEILERARSLLRVALPECKAFAATGRDGFFEAIGALKSLLELIEKNATTFVPGTAATASTSGHGDTPYYLVSEGEASRRRLHSLCLQATQLRLLANLLSALLYMRRRSFVDALAFIHAIVTITNAIPSARLVRPSRRPSSASASASVANSTQQVNAAVVEPVSPCSPIGAPGSKRAGGKEAQTTATLAEEVVDADAMRFSPNAGSPTTGGVGAPSDGLFNFFGGASEDLLRAVLDSISEEEDATADQDGAVPLTTAATSFLGGDSTVADAEFPKDAWSARKESQRETPEPEATTVSSRSNSHSHNSANTAVTGTPTKNHSALSGEDEEALGCYHESVAFHCFVLNVLLTVGLALEEVQPVVTCSTYTLAASRAMDVLGQRSALLDRCFRDGDDALSEDEDENSDKDAQTTASRPLLSASMPELAALLKEEVAQAGGKKDMTIFPRVFFATMPLTPLMGEESIAGVGDKERASLENVDKSQMMPPMHLVHLFPSC